MATYKLVDTEQLETDLKTVADAIREKGGTTDQLAFPDGMASAVEAIQAGGGDEPTPPADGKTRIYIHLDEGRTSPMLGVCPNGTVTVDWGDGTTPDTLTGTSTTYVRFTENHNYAEAGDYVITLTVDGKMLFKGVSNVGNGAYILRSASSSDNINVKYSSSVKKVEIGSNVSIGDYAFLYCYGLKSINIPNGITSFGKSAFEYCVSLQNAPISGNISSIGESAFENCSGITSVSLPDGITSISKDAFHTCRNLSSVNIPNSVSSIGNYAFYNCSNLANMTMPTGITSIGSSAFYGCYGMRYYDFSACTSVPTLSNTNAFDGIPADCEILIPAALFDEWGAATNWTTYASYMKAV